MEYTTVAQIENAIALQQDLRWHAKDPEVKKRAHERIQALRAELHAAKLAARQLDAPQGAGIEQVRVGMFVFR